MRKKTHDLCNPCSNPSNYPKTQIKGENMKTWHCLNSDGQIYLIGNFESFDEADIQANLMGLDAIWIIDQETATQWKNALS